MRRRAASARGEHRPYAPCASAIHAGGRGKARRNGAMCATRSLSARAALTSGRERTGRLCWIYAPSAPSCRPRTSVHPAPRPFRRRRSRPVRTLRRESEQIRPAGARRLGCGDPVPAMTSSSVGPDLDFCFDFEGFLLVSGSSAISSSSSSSTHCSSPSLQSIPT